MNGNRSFFEKLSQEQGPKVVLNCDDYPDYARDASEIKLPPSAIFFPETEAEVQTVIRSCRENNIPIVFRGAGTGYTGGAVPVKYGLVISLEKLTHLEIDKSLKTACCGPGVITKDLMEKAKEAGLFYPPDPASYDESTLGGNVAENAGGLHCKRYGVTKDYVIGLRAITIDGEIINTGVYNNKNDIFDLTSLLIGSEGLLAAVTEIAVRLIDLPQFGPTILATFDYAENAARAVAEITKSGIIPSVMEYMDGDAVTCSINYEKEIELDSAAALLLLETAGKNFRSDADKVIEICKRNKASLVTEESVPEKAALLWSIRRNLSKAVKASAKYKIAEDVAVPPSRLPELVAFVAEMNDRLPLRMNSYGHAGDGNLHVNFLTSDETLVEQGLIDKGIKSLFEKTIELGGTITGEHGIGLTKKDFLSLEFSPETIRIMKEIKSIFDNDNLLNPGKMF